MDTPYPTLEDAAPFLMFAGGLLGAIIGLAAALTVKSRVLRVVLACVAAGAGIGFLTRPNRNN